MTSVRIKIKILLFAAAREIAGREVLEIESFPGVTIGQLRTLLIQSEPRLSSMAASLLWAVNNSYASDNQQVSEADTVACFPPVSGG